MSDGRTDLATDADGTGPSGGKVKSKGAGCLLAANDERAGGRTDGRRDEGGRALEAPRADPKVGRKGVRACAQVPGSIQGARRLLLLSLCQRRRRRRRHPGDLSIYEVRAGREGSLAERVLGRQSVSQ